jgi:hypothetical protein
MLEYKDYLEFWKVGKEITKGTVINHFNLGIGIGNQGISFIFPNEKSQIS